VSTPWASAPSRRRKRRIAQKIAARGGLVHHLPRGLRNPYCYGREEMQALRSYVISRRGNPTEAPCRGAAWFFMEHAHDRRVVAKDWVGDVEVSTVFLSINHQFSPEGPPVLWETMVFGGPDDMDCRRYASFHEAKEGHLDVLAQVRVSASEGLETAPRPEA